MTSSVTKKVQTASKNSFNQLLHDVTNIQNDLGLDLVIDKSKTNRNRRIRTTTVRNYFTMNNNSIRQVSKRKKLKNCGQKRPTRPNLPDVLIENASDALETLQTGAVALQEGIIDTVSEAETQIVKINKKYKIKDKINSSGTLIYENLQHGAEIIGENLATGVKIVSKEISQIDTEKIPVKLTQSATSFIDTLKDEAEVISSSLPFSNSDKNTDSSDSSNLTDTLQEGALTALETIQTGVNYLGEQVIDSASIVGQEISNITGGSTKNKKKKKNPIVSTMNTVSNSAVSFGEQMTHEVSYLGNEVKKVHKNLGNTFNEWFSSLF